MCRRHSGKLAKQPVSFAGPAPLHGPGPARQMMKVKDRNPRVTGHTATFTVGRAETKGDCRSRPRRILIADCDREVCEFFACVAGRLGHEPLVLPAAALEAQDPGDVDLLLVEPALTGAVVLARALRRRRPRLPIVCASIYPADMLPSEELLVLAPVAYLVKPCSLARLTDALRFALPAHTNHLWEVTP